MNGSSYTKHANAIWLWYRTSERLANTATDSTYLGRYIRFAPADSPGDRYSSSYHTYQRTPVNILRCCTCIRPPVRKFCYLSEYFMRQSAPQTTNYRRDCANQLWIVKTGVHFLVLLFIWGGGAKMHEVKMKDETARHENARHETLELEFKRKQETKQLTQITRQRKHFL